MKNNEYSINKIQDKIPTIRMHIRNIIMVSGVSRIPVNLIPATTGFSGHWFLWITPSQKTKLSPGGYERQALRGIESTLLESHQASCLDYPVKNITDILDVNDITVLYTPR